MEKEGICVCLTDDRNIVLWGYDHGFIGGSTCTLDGKILVFGEVNKLADNVKIKAVADSLKMDVFSILSGDVVDFGGIKVIK